MGGLVLVVGALMVAAGGYEMVVGNGDILSERGWSAYIAGAVLVAGGFITVALGLAVRALEGLRGAILGQAMPVSAASAHRTEPSSEVSAVAAPAPPEPAREPSIEDAPTAPMLAAPPLATAAFEEPIIAHAEAENVAVRESGEMSLAGTTTTKAQHDDWLDSSFAEPEHETTRPGLETSREAPERIADPAEPMPPASAHADGPASAYEPEPAPVYVPETRGFEASPPEPIAAEPVAAEPVAAEPEPPSSAETKPTVEESNDDRATVSAREQTVPPPSPVIGRYESEGTSYVMYADGSIDAQSEAGVYRFASMAELKTFIES